MTPTGLPVVISRPPVNDDELHALVGALFGVNIPRYKVCEHHVAPFRAFADAFFGRPPNFALWYGSRGTGKSYMLAILAMMKAFVMEVDVTLLGGSMAQSINVHNHIKTLLDFPQAPRHLLAAPPTATEVRTTSGCTVRPLAASPTTVRGPHPSMSLLDEIDEMEWGIYNSALGQAMTLPNARGELIPEYVVASSTWQHVDGTFSKVRKEALTNGLPVFSWCWREVLQPNGWMDREFIERKRNSVPAEMFRVEYDLGEPSGEHSAFDAECLRKATRPYTALREIRKHDDHEFEYELPVPTGEYAAGADWAKSKDHTVLVVVRTDVQPHRVVWLRRVRRRPWPEMIEAFNQAVQRYEAVSAHDATGLGNVVHDLVDSRTLKVVMVGQQRTRLINEYISAMEAGQYTLPAGTGMFEAHLATTVDDVYAAAKWDSHLPDEVVAMAMAHRAVSRMPQPVDAATVKHTEDRPTYLRQFDHPPDMSHVQREGEVVVQDQDAITVLWL